jgi:23S rRNA U2552 (ribose-2'-O)-methylase RlmE/FtsJ
MKRICSISVPAEERRISFRSSPLWSLDTSCQLGYWADRLRHIKGLLDKPRYHKNWHMYKEYVNKYERVFTSERSSAAHGTAHIAMCTPLSRSYFKLWELIHDFKLLDGGDGGDGAPKTPKTTAHLAEGPGGFIEAVCDYRRPVAGSAADVYYGITLLLANQTAVPNWTKAQKVLRDYPQIRLHRGADDTGDLYRLENIHALVADAGRHSCDLVTGDGGIDYSRDYTKQEADSHRLILAQVYTALLLVRVSKHFVCKLFDTNDLFTQQLIWIVSVCFDVVHIVKPYTSRVANSERYLVACGYRGCATETEVFLRDLLRNWNPTRYLQTILATPLAASFTSAIHKYNEWHCHQQCICMVKCYKMIDTYAKKVPRPPRNLSEIRTQQEAHARSWCKKYHINYRRDPNQ